MTQEHKGGKGEGGNNGGVVTGIVARAPPSGNMIMTVSDVWELRWLANKLHKRNVLWVFLEFASMSLVHQSDSQAHFLVTLPHQVLQLRFYFIEPVTPQRACERTAAQIIDPNVRKEFELFILC